MNTDSLNATMPYHWMRLYDCYESTGITKGKSYCDDMMKYQIPAWDQGNLFNCYRANNV